MQEMWPSILQAMFPASSPLYKICLFGLRHSFYDYFKNVIKVKFILFIFNLFI